MFERVIIDISSIFDKLRTLARNLENNDGERSKPG
jgi:hypothetical protein